MKSIIVRSLKGKKRYVIPIAVIFASLMLLVVLAPAEQQIASYNPFSRPGGGGGGSDYYAYLSVSESGLSSEISSWSASSTYGENTIAPAPGSSGTITVVDTTSAFTVTLSWGGVPGYSTPGSVTVAVTGKTSGYNTYDETGTYSGSPAGPTLSSVSASPNPVDAGQTTTFSASGVSSNDVNGGTYHWSGLVSSSSSNPTYSGGSGGTEYLYYSTDAGSTSTVSTTLTVNSDPTISASANVQTVDAGQSISFSSSPSGGTTPYSYTWYEEPSGGSYSSFSTSQNPSYSFPSAGTYYVYVHLSDSAGYGVNSNTLTITVNSDPSVSASTSLNPADASQQITFSSSVSGGSGGGSYTWYSGSTSDQIGTGSSYSTSLSAGTYSIFVVYVDNSGYSVTSNTITETVNSDPSVSISSSQNPTDVGKSITLTASPSGGSGSYSYQWYANSNAISGATSSTYSPGDYSSSGTYSYYVSLTDGAGYTVNSNTIDETVNSDPTVSASASTTTADVGYSITFSASPSGGTSPYTYSWTIGGTQVSTSQDFSYSFSSAGSYTVTVTVTDSLGETYSASVSVTINNNPSVSVSSSQNPTDVSNSVTFTASESGGTGTISYAWTVNGASEGSGSTLSYSFSSSGSYTIEVTVTDGDGHTASASLTETVYSDPSVSIASSQNPADVGNSVTFTASPSGGSGSYSYQWYLNSNAVSGATASTYSTSFSSSGTDSIYVTIKDGVGNSATSSTLDETVNADPSVSISSSQNPTDVGNSVTFTASGSGGSGSYTYQWYLNGAAVSGATSSTYTTSFGSSGTDAIYVILTDGIGNTATSSTLTETVNADPTVSISSSQNPTDVGNSVTFTASAAQGTGSFSYTWYVNSATQSSTSQSLDYTFSSPGTYYVNVTVKDSLGDASSYSFTETVNSDPSVTISSSPAPTDAGVPVSFSSSPTGGTTPYNYTWEINSVVVSYASSFQYTFTSAGSYSVLLTVRDANGNTASASLTQTVNADPAATISSEYATVDQGVNDTFTANVNGGTYPFNYTWYDGPTVVNYSQSFHMAFPDTGTQAIKLVVKDSLGESYTTSVSISVIQKPSISINGPDKTDVSTLATFTGNATYGTEPYNFYWFVNGVNVTPSSSGLYLSYSFTSPGTYNVSIKAVDSQDASATSYLLVTVSSRPTLSISSSVSSGDPGLVGSFSATASGGSSPYTYSWTIGGSEVGSQPNLTYTFNSEGTMEIEVRITDFAGNSVTAYTNVTINPPPEVSMSASHSAIDVNVKDLFSATGSYGTLPYNYTWEINGQTAGYGSSLSYAFTTAGSYSVKVILRDADGSTTSSPATITVFGLPVPSILANRTIVDQGMSVSFLSGVSGGTMPYNYTWELSGSVIGYGSIISHTFVSAGSYTVTLVVSDSFGNTGSASLSITVNTPMTASISPLHSRIDSGQSDTFTSGVAGGTPVYYYLWEINGNAASSQENFTYSFQPGDYNITLIVTDALGERATAVVSITVEPGLSATLSRQYATVDTNITDTLSLTAANGTGPYTYVIMINGAVVSSSDSYAQYFTIPGTYDITAYVNDSMAESIELSSTIVVRANPTVTIVTPTNKTDANVPISFRGILSGGTGPYGYSWLIAGHTYTNATLVYSFSSSGAYSIQLTVTDAFGREAIASVNETVYADPHASFVAPTYIRASIEEPLSLNISGGIAPYAIQWYFPSGEQISGNNVTHAFSSSGPDTIETQVTDSSGYTDTQNFTVDVHLFVAIAANTTSGLGPLAVQFSSSVLGGSDYAYNWSFGNGQHSLQQNPAYSFQPGNYSVTFKVTSANGATGEENITITSLPPPVSFEYSSGLNITQTFHFTAIPNWDAKGPYNMSWSFPNGQTVTGMNISYKFPVYNEINTVIATLNYGSGKSWTQYLTVRMVPAIPSVSFSPPSIIPVDTMLSLNATAKAPDSNSFTYAWDINGTSDSGQSVLYYFQNPGNYSVRVTVTDSLGAAASVTRNIQVLPQETNSSIVLSYTKSAAGPMTYYTIKVQSLHGITAVEAFLGTTMISPVEINSSYTPQGEVAYFNLSMDQGNYNSGTYGIRVVAFNNDSASNSITMPFTVSSILSQNPFSLGTVISFFGGLPNFLIIILTLSGIGIAAMQLRKPPIDVVATSGGKTHTYQLDTKK
ncbi:MAG: PKD domain-containing protein [Thermoplasmata archaeon]|nr:PKD domain-containing protein [Candidatus Sysuiplasma jiujiangense]